MRFLIGTFFQFSNPQSVLLSGAETQTPPRPIIEQQFIRTWKMHYPHLLISSKGSCSCDYFIRHKNSLSEISGDLREMAINDYELHRSNTTAEYNFYMNVLRTQRAFPRNDALHVMFDFPEKVLLPSMELKPRNWWTSMTGIFTRTSSSIRPYCVMSLFRIVIVFARRLR